MRITVNNESDFKFSENHLAEYVQLADYVLLQQQAPLAACVSLTFVEASEMQALNEEYRGKQGPTDVLAFSCDTVREDANTASASSPHDDADDDDPSIVYWKGLERAQDAAPLLLGDVVIAPEVAAFQADAENRDFDAEINLLIVHGLLHLLGYDHEGCEEAAHAMETRQAELLQDWQELHLSQQGQQGQQGQSNTSCSGACCG